MHMAAARHGRQHVAQRDGGRVRLRGKRKWLDGNRGLSGVVWVLHLDPRNPQNTWAWELKEKQPSRASLEAPEVAAPGSATVQYVTPVETLSDDVVVYFRYFNYTTHNEWIFSDRTGRLFRSA